MADMKKPEKGRTPKPITTRGTPGGPQTPGAKKAAASAVGVAVEITNLVAQRKKLKRRSFILSTTDVGDERSADMAAERKTLRQQVRDIDTKLNELEGGMKDTQGRKANSDNKSGVNQK